MGMGSGRRVERRWQMVDGLFESKKASLAPYMGANGHTFLIRSALRFDRIGRFNAWLEALVLTSLDWG